MTAYTLLIDGEAARLDPSQSAFNNFISWSGLDIGRDRSSPVSHYEAPFEFTSQLLWVTVDMHDDQKLDGEVWVRRRWQGSSRSNPPAVIARLVRNCALERAIQYPRDAHN